MTDFSVLRANDTVALEGRSSVCARVMSAGGQWQCDCVLPEHCRRTVGLGSWRH